MDVYIFVLFALNGIGMNPFLDLADTENSKGYTIDSYVSATKAVLTDKSKNWILEEFIKDEMYFQELFRKMLEISQKHDNESVTKEKGQLYIIELSDKRPYFHKYMPVLLSYIR